jgi:membrane protease YdiL (CAAX protease family)
MDDKRKLQRFVGIIAVILVAGSFFVIGYANGGTDNWATLVSLAIVVSLAVIALIVARIKQKELKSGFPSEDERSRANRMRAGYLAFYISMFFLLGMGFVHSIFEDDQLISLPTSEWLMIYVAVMGSIFLVLNAYISRKGAPR